ncbi:MAG: class I SAM-dependent methyltransferase [Ilumatobacteraceae bacterium]
MPPLSLSARFRWDVIERVVAVHRPTSVLEFGAGRGAVGARLAATARYVGVEPDDSSRASAVAALSGTSGRMLERLEDVDPDQRFAMVCAFEVLEHVPDDVGALRSWCTRLESGGIVLLSVPAHAGRFGPADEKVGHLRRYDRSDLDELVARAGLSIEQVWSTGWPMGRVVELAWNLVARVRPGSGSASVRSSASGRWLQPSMVVGRLWSVVAVPGIVLQRRRFADEAGTGWVVLCRR